MLSADVMDERHEAFLEKLLMGHSISSACKLQEITRNTYYTWRERFPLFRVNAARALLTQVSVVEDALYKKAVGGDVQAQRFYLCNRRPDRWRQVSRIEHNIIPSNAMRPAPELKNLSLDQLETLQAIANEAHGVEEVKIIETNATVIQPGSNGKHDGNGRPHD